MDREQYERQFNLYVDTLMSRDRVRKDAHRAQAAYIREFGDLMIETFRVRTDCLRKERIISYCQQMKHYGRPIDGAMMDRIIDSHMEEKEEELQAILQEYEAIMADIPATEEEDRRTDALYRELSLMLHPDIREDLAEDEEVKALWEKVKEAYTEDDTAALEALCGKAEELQERNIAKASSQEDADAAAAEPPQLQALGMRVRQIREEIGHITSADPYSFLELLSDPDSVASQKQALQEDIERHQRYSENLDKEMEAFEIVR